MSDIGYNRCPNDDWRAGSARVGENPETGEPIEVNINGISAAIAVQSALATLTAAMKAGHEVDFLEKIALILYQKVEGDPHCLCPMLTLMSMLLLMVQGQAGVSFGKDGRVVIEPPDLDIDPGPSCMYEEYEEYGNGSDEGPVDTDGAGTSGEGDGQAGGEGPGDAPPDDGGGDDDGGGIT